MDSPYVKSDNASVKLDSLAGTLDSPYVKLALGFLRSLTPLQAAALAVVVSVAVFVVQHEIKYRALWSIPGPFLSRYTNAYRCYLAWRYSDRPGGLSYQEYLHSIYGRTVRVGPKTVFSNDPDAVHVVLNFKDRLTKTDQIAPFIFPGQPTVIAAILDEHEHSNLRRAIGNVYSVSTMKAYEPLVDIVAKELSGILQKKSQKGEIVNIALWCKYYAYDAITCVTYGEPLGFLRNEKDMFDLIAHQLKHIGYVRLATQWPFLDYLMRTNWLVQALTPIKTSAFFEYSERRVKEEEQKQESEKTMFQRTMLHHLFEASEKYPEEFPDGQVNLLCSTNLLAGTLSPSTTMECIMEWLAQNREGQEKLAREIRAHAQTVPATLDEILNMPYLEAVMREGYRLSFDSDIAMERKAGPRGLTLPTGEQIPAGFDVGLSQPSIQKEPSVWGDEPRVFKPERWFPLKGETAAQFKDRKALMDRTDLTFSKGSRACIGKNFTRLEVAKALTTILYRFKLELAEEPRVLSVPVRLIPRE